MSRMPGVPTSLWCASSRERSVHLAVLAGAWIVHVHDWCLRVGGVGAPIVHDWLVAIVCLMRNDGFRLREWEESDAEVLLAAYAGAGMETERSADVTTVEDAERLIAGWAEDAVANRAYTFAVVDGADILGQMRVTTQMRVHSIGWISYWTLEKHRGRGVGSTGLKLLAKYCFDELGLFRLETGHRLDNPGSCRVATAAGFLVEGRERQKLLYDGVRYDTETHARLATDPDPA